MFDWLFPKEAKFFDYFDQQTALMVATAKELKKLLSTESDIISTVSTIKDLEHQADDIVHLTKEALHKVFLPPLDRDDIHNLISCLDDVVDCLDDVAQRVSIYKIQEMRPEAKVLADLALQSTELVEQAVKGLRNMKRAHEVQKLCYRIHEVENWADALLAEVVGNLFAQETEIRVLIKWKEIYEKIEESTDCCERAATIIEGIILEQL